MRKDTFAMNIKSLIKRKKSVNLKKFFNLCIKSISNLNIYLVNAGFEDQSKQNVNRKKCRRLALTIYFFSGRCDGVLIGTEDAANHS